MEIEIQKVIRTRGTMAIHELCLEIQEAVLNGWRVRGTARNAAKEELCRKRGISSYEAILYKVTDRADPDGLPKITPTLEDFAEFDRNNATTEELMRFAERFEIKLPSKVTSGKGAHGRIKGEVRRHMEIIYTAVTGEPAPLPETTTLRKGEVRNLPLDGTESDSAE